MQEFKRAITVEDWKHFNSYARRVRSFDLATTLKSERRQKISDDILYTLALSRPTLSILPNLDELTVSGSRGAIWLRSVGLFFRPELSTIKICQTDDEQLTHVLFGQIAERSNRLTKLIIDLSSSDMHLVKNIDEFESMMTRLHRLRYLYLPSHMMTSLLLLTLETLPDLVVVYSSPPASQLNMDFSVANLEMNMTVPGCIFTSLCTLRLQVSLVEIANIASSCHGFAPKLETFDIDVISEESEMTLQLFLDSLAKSCPNIQTLRLHLPHFMASLYITTPGDVITYGTLAAITTWKALKCFSLSFLQRVDISNHELVYLLSECKNLRHLDLNCEPWSFGRTALTLGFLSLIPATCQLETLSVHVDATRLDELPYDSPRLGNLKKLCLGTSNVEEINRIALYLSGILPEQCVLDVDPRLLINNPSNPIGSGSYDRRKKWESVKNLLPLLFEARLLERQRLWSR